MASAAAPPRAALLSLPVRLAMALAICSMAVASWGGVRQAIALRLPLPDGAPPGDGCTIWFVGSSSIHKWSSLAADMAPWSVRRRGVNGALLDEIDRRFANDAPAPPPAAVVFYAGENDVAAGISPADTAGELFALVAMQQRRMPGVPAFVVALKPSPARWSMRPAQLEVNRLLADGLARFPHAHFVPVGEQLLVDGVPGPFYQEDGIHLAPAGYRRWGSAIRRAIDAGVPPALARRCLGRQGMTA